MPGVAGMVRQVILESYIQREIREKLFWICGLLVLVLTSHRFVDYLADAAAGKLPGGLLLHLLLMKMLAILPRLLPVAVFMAVVLALSRLSADREITIIRGAGLAGGFQLRSVGKFSLWFALPVFLVSFFLSPWAETEVLALKNRAQQESDITGIRAGRFKEFSNGDRVVYVRSFSPGGDSMQEIFLQVRDSGKLGVLTSDRARFRRDPGTGARYILFENGHRYVGTSGRLDYRITAYRTYAQLVEQGDTHVTLGRLEGIPSSDLLGSGRTDYQAEIQWRLSYVVASVLLPLLAVAISRFPFGENRYVALIISILVYFIYSNLLSIARTLVIREVLPAAIGLWWVHGLLLAVIFVLYQQRERMYVQRRAAPAGGT